ncbi:MAG: hypothetical protein AAGB51_09470 [Planctomycetota bacterium]
MSYDLYIFPKSRVRTLDDAYEAMDELEEALDSEEQSPEDPALDRVANALLDRFPGLDELSDDEAEISPWAGPVEAGHGCIELNLRSGIEQSIIREVLEIIAIQGAVAFDPQTDECIPNPTSPE